VAVRISLSRALEVLPQVSQITCGGEPYRSTKKGKISIFSHDNYPLSLRRLKNLTILCVSQPKIAHSYSFYTEGSSNPSECDRA
jgi:hypothetical protein